MIKSILDKIFKNPQMSPSRKLCNDIQDDYWGYDQDKHYTLLNKKGFLDKELCINGKKYNVVSREQTNASFGLTVKDANNVDVFNLVILYGKNSDNQDIIYIERFCRLSDQRCGIGKAMANYVKELAESRGFGIIGLHSVAEYDKRRDTMNQEQLDAFYTNYLNGNNVKYVPMNDSGSLTSIEYDKRW